MEEQNQETPAPEEQLDQKKIERYLEKLKFEQNLPMALVAGLVSALVSASIWAAISVLTGYQIGIIAIGVGMLVGYAVSHFGKGLDPVYGIIGGAFAILGCALGNYFSMVSMASSEFHIPFMDALASVNFTTAVELIIETFNPMDIIFYAFAAYEGYKFAFRKITEEEIIEAGIR